MVTQTVSRNRSNRNSTDAAVAIPSTDDFACPLCPATYRHQASLYRHRCRKHGYVSMRRRNSKLLNGCETASSSSSCDDASATTSTTDVPVPSTSSVDVRPVSPMCLLPEREFTYEGFCVSCFTVLDCCYIECTHRKCILNKAHWESEEYVEPVVLCLKCFSLGAEVNNHEKDHPYRLVNNAGPPLFQPKKVGEMRWLGLKEEQNLLEAVERHNCGNWEEVAGLVPARKLMLERPVGSTSSPVASGAPAPQQIKEHYFKYYHPPSAIGLVTQQYHPSNAPTSPLFSPSLLLSSVVDHTSPQLPSPVPGTSAQTPQRSARKRTCSVDDLKLLAYMPRRGDFELDWDNGAEEAIAALLQGAGLLDDDDATDRTLRLHVLDVYRRKLNERRRRHQVAYDHSLIPSFISTVKPSANMQMKCTIGPKRIIYENQVKQLKETLRPAAQFVSSTAFDSLVSNIMDFKSLKSRVRQLRMLRARNVTQLSKTQRSFRLTPSQARKKKVIWQNRKNRNMTGYSRFIRWRDYITGAALLIENGYECAMNGDGDNMTADESSRDSMLDPLPSPKSTPRKTNTPQRHNGANKDTRIRRSRRTLNGF